MLDPPPPEGGSPVTLFTDKIRKSKEEGMYKYSASPTIYIIFANTIFISLLMIFLHVKFYLSSLDYACMIFYNLHRLNMYLFYLFIHKLINQNQKHKLLSYSPVNVVNKLQITLVRRWGEVAHSVYNICVIMRLSSKSSTSVVFFLKYILNLSNSKKYLHLSRIWQGFAFFLDAYKVQY